MIASPLSSARLAALAFLLGVFALSTAHAELQRQTANLNFFPELPVVTAYSTENAIAGGMTFSSPICTTFPPGETNRLYVVLRGGSITVVNNLSGVAPNLPDDETFMDLATYLSGQGTPLSTTLEDGLLAMVFHPNYNQNGYFYLYFSIRASSQPYQRLARFQATGTPGNYNAATSANPATQMPILTIYDREPNHNGGDLAFGADGYLYLSLGDEGNAGDFYNNARFINKSFWGQMLRLDVDNRPENLLPNAHSQSAATAFPSAIHAGTYRVPADNPFIGATTWHGQTIAANTVRTEIYATGLRNPFRFTIDPPTGRIFLGDVGQYDWEEVDIIVKGGDYGWSWREGTHAFNQSSTIPPRFPDNSPGTTNQPPATGFNPIEPIYDYFSDNNFNSGVIWGQSVCGGMVYRGNLMTELQGAYIFSDMFGGAGIIAALRETSPGVWTAERLATRPQIVDYGIDPRNGEPLLCSLLGTIYRLTRSTSGNPPPALLSQTGAFSNLANLTPSTGVIPYEPNVSFWSDRSIKSRWFAVENAAHTATFSGTGNWTFPSSMVWMKHFDIETTPGVPATRRKLETRFLVKTTTGVYGLSYKWRNDQSDADLIPEQGESSVIPSSNPAQTWRFPSRGECLTCHTQTAGFALSFNTPQLNRAHTYGGDVQNQILALSSAGYLSSPVTSVAELPAFAPASDTTQSLEWRVRSYLSVNCVQCHQPGGASQGNWDARHTTPTDLANLINGALVNPINVDNRFVVPNRTDLSMLLKRQQGDGVARMPPLATAIRDLDNEALVQQWINSLGSRQSLEQWQTAHFGSAGAPNAAANFDADGDGHTNYFEYLTGTQPTASASAWTYGQTTVVGGQVQIHFTQPANRAAIVEVSSDLINWQPWDVVGNGPTFPAANTARSITAATAGTDRLFRVRFTAP